MITTSNKIDFSKISIDNSILLTNYLEKENITLTDNYFIIPFSKINSFLKEFNTYLSDNGYPFAKIKLTNIVLYPLLSSRIFRFRMSISQSYKYLSSKIIT